MTQVAEDPLDRALRLHAIKKALKAPTHSRFRGDPRLPIFETDSGESLADVVHGQLSQVPPSPTPQAPVRNPPARLSRRQLIEKHVIPALRSVAVSRGKHIDRGLIGEAATQALVGMAADGLTFTGDLLQMAGDLAGLEFMKSAGTTLRGVGAGGEVFLPASGKGKRRGRKFVGAVARTAPQFTSQIAGTVGATMLGVGPIVAFTALGVAPVVGSQYSESKEKALAGGLTEDQSIAQATSDAVVAGTITAVTNALGARFVIGPLLEPAKQVAKTFAGRMASGAFGEGGQEATEKVLKDLTLALKNEDNEQLDRMLTGEYWSEVALEAGVGAVLGGAANVALSLQAPKSAERPSTAIPPKAAQAPPARAEPPQRAPVEPSRGLAPEPVRPPAEPVAAKSLQEVVASSIKRDKADKAADFPVLSKMNSQQIADFAEQREASTKAREQTVLGKAFLDEHNKLSRKAGSERDKIAKPAQARLDEMEASLTEAQRNTLFGIDSPPGLTHEEIREIGRDVTEAEAARDQNDVAIELARAMGRVGEATKLDEMSVEQFGAAMAIRAVGRRAVELGLDLRKVQDEALVKAASRFSDPADARFMLERFIKSGKSPKEPTKSKGLLPVAARPPAEPVKPPEVIAAQRSVAAKKQAESRRETAKRNAEFHRGLGIAPPKPLPNELLVDWCLILSAPKGSLSVTRADASSVAPDSPLLPILNSDMFCSQRGKKPLEVGKEVFL